MKRFTILGFLLVSIVIVNAQNSTCIVAIDSLKGTYEGGCADGKANGEGIAVGIDSYAGTFKNGYPDGKGKYTWKNGNYYFGSWKKGQKEGKGELHLPVNGVDSVIYGFWKKNVYKGRYENPFIIHNTSSGIGKVEVSKMRGTNSTITIEVQSSVGNGGVSGTTPTNTPGVVYATSTSAASLTEIRTLTGSYNTKAVNKLTNKELNILQGVIFPFKAVFVFGNNSVELEILEEGEWTVIVPVQVQ